MAVEKLLPDNFGYAIFTYLYSFVMLVYLSLKVGAARKKYKVYRAHQNTLEVYPQWLLFQTIAALEYPTAASVLGVIWVTSRFSYAWGYYTGDPKKRMNGVYGYIGLFGVILLSISVALKLQGLM
ncbi:hypothetical protein DNTS_025953 [Danionella cerebrum]|uniref:Microsomal glutathione S-transferase 3 n=1 Tax=Danionella cerebrum TaxID=2873325 RepID=A0A553R830_9TELE|nr:hypothetical protein DNTS_025953 [Danionella translucida]